MAEQIAHLYQPASTGRHSDLADVHKLTVLLTALSEGHYRTTACSLADISRQTLHKWERKAENGEEAAQALVDALEKAEALSIDRYHQNINQAATDPKHWTAAAWVLERTKPAQYGRNRDEGPKMSVQVGISIHDPNVQLRQRTIDTSATLSPVPRNELACGKQG